MSVALQQPTEIEAKFAVADPSVLDKLARERTAVAGYRLGTVTRKVVHDLYLDTADFRLLRHGYQLRVRAGADGSIATLKARGAGNEVGIYHRLEIEEALAGESLPGAVGDLPSSLAEALVDVVGSRGELTPICAIEQTRRVREVSPEAPGRTRRSVPVLGVLSLDEMRIRQSWDGAILARAYEIEIELAPRGDAAELHGLADRFLGAFDLIPSTESKLERALAIISRHPATAPENWQGVQASMHMAEACRIIWQEQFMQMLLCEAGVRFASDPEYVHDARVAIRRVRAAARIYEGYFKTKATRRYLKRLRRTARLRRPSLSTPSTMASRNAPRIASSKNCVARCVPTLYASLPRRTRTAAGRHFRHLPVAVWVWVRWGGGGWAGLSGGGRGGWGGAPRAGARRRCS